MDIRAHQRISLEYSAWKHRRSCQMMRVYGCQRWISMNTRIPIRIYAQRKDKPLDMGTFLMHF